MKALLMIATLFTVTTATATSLMPAPNYLEFSVVKANYSPSHVTNPGHATVTVDLNQDKVTLQIEQTNNCPPNAMCILSMPVPVIVELPIVQVSYDRCGVRTIVAKKDSRPVDGALEVITVKDVSYNVCNVNFSPSASYRTEYFNRMGGKDIKLVSRMVLEQFWTVLAE
jgi:hypothetical protein